MARVHLVEGAMVDLMVYSWAVGVPEPRDTAAQIRAALQLGISPEMVEALSLLRGLGGPFAELAAIHDSQERLISEATASHDALSQRGWGVVNLPTHELTKATTLVESGNGDAADSLLAALWDDETRTGRAVARVGILGAADPHMRHLSQHRRRLLAKARHHHHNGAYEAAVPIVLAQVEGITADSTEGSLFFSKGARAAGVDDPSRLVSIPAALPAVRLAYIRNVSTTQAEGILSRHGILHGRELAYDTRVISAKCWSLLDAVVEWAMPLADEIAKRRVDDRRMQRAGSHGANRHGQRLDDREFLQTREALRWVSAVQTGQHRNRGHFHSHVVDEWLGAKDFTRRGLPETPGIHSCVSDDGQVWWAWRRTVSGWVLGMALIAVDGTFQEYLYAGAEAPNASPVNDPNIWGEPWLTPPDWMSLEEE